jgi:hypothetical protein
LQNGSHDVETLHKDLVPTRAYSSGNVAAATAAVASVGITVDVIATVERSAQGSRDATATLGGAVVEQGNLLKVGYDE